MDDTTFSSLRSALEVTPDNLELRLVLVRACLDRGNPQAAAELVRAVVPEHLDSAEARQTAAQACLAAQSFEAALSYAAGDEPETLLLRARAHLGLEQMEEGRRCYDQAVAAKPLLEDLDLRDRLSVRIREVDRSGDAPSSGSNVREFPDAGDGRTDGPKLRVISNEDAGESEVHRFLQPEQDKVTFDDVGGLEGIKKQIRKRILLPFQKPSLFQRFKKRAGGGILLYGPPGCGKTLMARATAGECGAAFFNVAISDILDMWIGESERKLHAIFETARNQTPAVLFFDELEGIGGKRQYSREATYGRIVSQFLSEMDGFTQENSGVLVLAATNVPWAIDPAFRRPGRFDRVVFVSPPDRPARAAILDMLLAERPVADGVDTATIAGKTSGFSGADLQELVETAVDDAIEETLEAGEEKPVTTAHLRRALDEVKPTTLEWLTTARNYARYANEAGQYDEVLDFLARHGKR